MLAAFDIDNVICATIDRARTIIASDLGIDEDRLCISDIYAAPISSTCPQTASRISIPHSFWLRADLLMSCAPIEGSLDALWRLYDRGLLGALITRRPPEVEALTLDWLKQHDAPPVPAYFVGSATPDSSYANCKAKVCRSIGATHLVDDHCHELEAAYRNAIQPIAIDAAVGRSERNQFLLTYPQIPLAPDAAAAADLLMSIA